MYILDVTRVDLLTNSSELNGDRTDIFVMSKLIIAYQSYKDYTGAMPEGIIMTERQCNAYIEHLAIVAGMLGLDTSQRKDKVTYNGCGITIKK